MCPLEPGIIQKKPCHRGMDIRGMYMSDDDALTELEESLIVCNTILSKTDSLIRALKDWDIKVSIRKTKSPFLSL